jgi:pimeloyl-ACP methyl ester carboxylesterase
MGRPAAVRPSWLRPSPRLGAVLGALLALQACATPDGGGPPPPVRAPEPTGAVVRPASLAADAVATAAAADADPFGVGDPEDVAVLVFNHGSTYEGQPDPCQPDPDRPGSTTPLLMKDLAGRVVAGHRLVVYAYCTPSRVGAFHHPSGQGELKVEKRARDIAALVAELRARGVPAGRIFLAGQSAGAWASLMVARRDPGAVGGVLAFAPAFAGEAATRPAGWQAAQDRLMAEIAAPAPLPALVYAFPGDTYNAPDALAPLAGVPGTDLRVVPADRMAGVPCGPHPAHATLHNDCFRRARAGEVLAWIAGRLGGGGTRLAAR